MIDLLLAVVAAALSPEASSTPEAAAPAAKAAPPAALQAEPQQPSGRFTTATEVRPILNATRANWISVREFDGQDLVYVTHLWAWRCGLVQLKLGVNGAAPEIWPLPDCHLDQAQPNAILEGDGLPYLSFPLQSVDTVTVEITYDDLAADRVTVDRLGRPQD